MSFRGGYRLIGADDGVAWGAFPAYYDGGPNTVATDGWGVSRTIRAGHPELGVELRVYRTPVTAEVEYHPCTGRYDDDDSANRAAYEAGATQYMVYRDSEWNDLATQLLEEAAR